LAIRINQELLDDAVFLAEYRRLGGFKIDPRHPAAKQEADALRRLAEQRVVGSVLLRQRAVAAGITVSAAEIENLREEQWGKSGAAFCGVGVRDAIREQLLIEKYCTWIMRHEPRPSRREAEAFHRSQRERFHQPEQVKLIQVVRNIHFPEDEASARDAVEAAENALRAGRPFHQVAEEYSDCGGQTILGWVKRGDMVKDFEDAVFAVPRGHRSDIFRTVFGLHIVSVLDHRKAGYQSFEEIRPALAREMYEARKVNRINAEIAKAIRSAVIVQIPNSDKEGASR
jgi:parvulin-like peptidyl-prolyl isomerase